LDPDAAEHERPVRLVLEFIGGVDTAAHGHVPRGAFGQLAGLGHGHDRCDRQQPPDTVVRAECAQDRDARRKGDQTQGDGDQGCHGGDYTRRTWKGPKEPPRHVGVDAIAAVSIVRPLRAARYATGRDDAGSTGLVHQCASFSPGYPPFVHILALGYRSAGGAQPCSAQGALPASDCDDFGASAVEIGCRRAVAAARAMAVSVEPCSIV
jgi:hypothetical protein